MFDFEYIFYRYKKTIYILGIIFMTFVILSIGGYVYLSKDISSQISISEEGEMNVYTTKGLVSKEREFFYTSKFFPYSYDFSCQGNPMCKEYQDKSGEIAYIPLGTIGGTIIDEENIQVDVEDFLSIVPSAESYLSTVKNNLLTEDIDLGGGNDRYKKYFSFKQQGDQDLFLSDMEILCAKEIIGSMQAGVADSEKIISERIQNECGGLESISTYELAVGAIEEDLRSILLGLSISKFRVEYSIKEKINGEFQHVSTEEILYEYDLDFSYDGTL